MSIDIKGKLARGEELTDYEIQYARDRDMELPDEYSSTGDELDSLKKADLVEMAKPLGIEGASSMKIGELRDAIRAANEDVLDGDDTPPSGAGGGEQLDV